MISVVPSGNTARTSRARIDSFTFSLRFGRRGGKFLGGYIFWLLVHVNKLRTKRCWPEGPGNSRIENRNGARKQQNNVSLSVHQNVCQFKPSQPLSVR